MICKMQTLPCPPALTTDPALQSGGNTPLAKHHSSSPEGAGPLFSPCQVLLTWVFSSCCHPRTLQTPSVAGLFLVVWLQIPRASEKPGCQDNSHPVPGPHRHWTTGHQDVWEGSSQASPRTCTPSNREQQASLTRWVRRPAGLSLLRDFVTLKKNFGKGILGLRATGQEKWDWRKECKRLTSSVF